MTGAYAAKSEGSGRNPVTINILTGMRKTLSRVNTPLVVFCGALFFLYMFNVVGDVFGRYVLKMPIQGTVEIGELILPMATFLALAYIQMDNGHIRVTLLLDHISPKLRFVFDIMAILVGIGLTVLMVWQSLTLAVDSIKIRELASISSPVPVYIGKMAYFIGATVFCLQFIIDLITKIFEIFGVKIPEGRIKS